MRVPLNWLEDYIDGLPAAEKLEDILTLRGLEVEEITEGLTGEILVFELTPNRGDCASIAGIAREVSSALDREITLPKAKLKEPGDNISESFSLENKNPRKCPLYFLKLINSPRISPSPKWMKERIQDCGIRPQNNIVDITNYVLLESGQPLHAFDADKIKDGRIIVRDAKKGEKIKTLDGVHRTLEGGELVIADTRGPLALAGVMGGVDSAVTSSAKRVLLEAAFFLPETVSRTETLHGLKSESSYRFARGVDPEGVEPALHRAAALSGKLASGKGAPGLLEHRGSVPSTEKITLEMEKVHKCLGCEIPLKEAESYLKSLQFKVSKKGKTLSVGTPSFRSDVKREIDLIEEIARCRGYENIPETMPRVSAEKELVPPEDIFERAEETLRGRGFYQVVTPTLFDGEQSRRVYRRQAKVVEVANPITENLNIMRPDLLAGLLKTLLYNANRDNSPLKFYERGSVFTAGQTEACEEEKLSFIRRGGDFFRLKSLAAAVLDEMKQDWEFNYKSSPRWFKGNRSAGILIGGKAAGELGEVKKEILKIFEMEDENIFGCNLNLDAFDGRGITDIKFKPWSQYPSVYRDISIVADAKLTHSEIYDTILSSGGGILKDIRLYDIYTGGGIKRGFKSMTYRLKFNSEKRTLSSEEVKEKMDKIIRKLKNSLSVSLRDS